MSVINFDKAREDAAATREPGDDTDEERRPLWERLGVRTMAQTLQRVYQRCQTTTETRSVSTCHPALDYALGGFRPRRVTVLGAVTSWGKSTYALMVADEAIRAGQRVLYLSAEDDEVSCGKRIAARRSRVNAMRLRDERITDEDDRRLLDVVSRAEPVPWFLDGGGKPAEKLAADVTAILKEAREAGTPYDLVVVDYLQCIGARAQDRRNEVSKVARLMADAIKGGDAAGLLLSQLARLEHGKEPTKFSLKESGDLENLAEHILLGIEQEDVNSRTLQSESKRLLRVAKNKDGPPGRVDAHLPFDEALASFMATPKGGW